MAEQAAVGKAMRLRVKLTPAWWPGRSAAVVGRAAMAVREKWPLAEIRMTPGALFAVVDLAPDLPVVNFIRQRNDLRKTIVAAPMMLGDT